MISHRDIEESSGLTGTIRKDFEEAQTGLEEEKGNHGILAERRATRENSTAEIRQRELGEAVQFNGATRAAGSAFAADPGRGEGHRGATTSAPGQAVTS